MLESGHFLMVRKRNPQSFSHTPEVKEHPVQSLEEKKRREIGKKKKAKTPQSPSIKEGQRAYLVLLVPDFVARSENADTGTGLLTDVSSIIRARKVRAELFPRVSAMPVTTGQQQTPGLCS